jgi:hypothetical protein
MMNKGSRFGDRRQNSDMPSVSFKNSVVTLKD